MSRNTSSLRALMGVLVAGLPALGLAVPLWTAFTYQGSLKDNGAPANGPFDFQFALYNLAAGGVAIATTAANDVPVTGGLFTTTIDFGANVFDGDAKWLEIGVRPGASGGAYTILAGRQALTVAPYALQTRGMTVDTNLDVNLVDLVFADPAEPYLGIGRSTPITGADQFGVHSPSAGNTFGGMYLSTEGETGKPFYGYAAGGTVDAYHFFDGNTDKWQLYSNGGTRLTVDPTGDVGIGTTTPKQKLHVAGDYYGRGHVYLYAYEGDGQNGTAYVQGRDDSGTSDVDLRFRTQNNGAVVDVMTLTNDGNVGIGNTTPGAKLVVSHNSSQNSLYSVNFGTGRAATFQTFAGGAETVYIIGGSATSSALRVVSTGAGGALSVQGTASVDILQITGADLAEKFPVSDTSEAIAPGTVMAIDPANPGKLCMASGAYNRRVAGVVSGAGDIPLGAVLGNLPGHEDAPPIALSGRVWVRCDASAGAIEAGDLLTTAELPGHAMKASDHTRSQGAVIGKAMTGLTEGQGLVLVLVSLQ